MTHAPAARNTRCVVVGFRCVVRPPDGRGKPIFRSRVFTVRAACEECVRLARASGYRYASLETIYGVDAAGGIAGEAT